LWSSEETVDEVIEQHDINYVLRRNKPEVFDTLRRTKSLELSFADSNYMLFSRTGKAEFPLISTLLVFPQCWSNNIYQNNFSQGIQGEIERSEKLFTDKQYTLKNALELVKAYLAADDKKEYFRTLHFEEKHSDVVQRIALYIAMKDADKDTVSKLAASVGLKNDYDFLLYSYYLARNGEYEDAENLAYYFLALDKAGELYNTYDKLGILARILRMIKEHGQIQQFELSYVEELESILKKTGYPIDEDLSFDFMCK
jgi:hypothetical protein